MLAQQIRFKVQVRSMFSSRTAARTAPLLRQCLPFQAEAPVATGSNRSCGGEEESSLLAPGTSNSLGLEAPPNHQADQVLKTSSRLSEKSAAG